LADAEVERTADPHLVTRVLVGEALTVGRAHPERAGRDPPERDAADAGREDFGPDHGTGRLFSRLRLPLDDHGPGHFLLRLGLCLDDLLRGWRDLPHGLGDLWLRRF